MALTTADIFLYASSFFGLYSAILFLIVYFENRDRLHAPAPKRFPVVTVAVPAYNEEHTVAGTIQSLLELDYPKEKLDIIVVDDGSKDGTLAIARSFEKTGRVRVFTKPNGGKGTALNFALTHARGEFFGALDADSFVESDCLKKMIGYFDNPNVMAVTPAMKVRNPQGILQRVQAAEYLLGVYLRKVFGMMGSIHVTPGPFSIYRKWFFDTYGGYDAHNITEDIEVALRIQRHQFIIENVIDGVVTTVSPRSFKQLHKQRLRWYTGFLKNVVAYRDLFSLNHGQLGLFILPGSFITVGIAIVLLFLTLSRVGDMWYRQLLDMVAIRFDIIPLINFEFSAFSISTKPLVIIGMLALVFGIAMVCIAKKQSREHKGVVWSYTLFLLTYWALFAYWWIISIGNHLLGRNVGWGTK